MNTPRAGERLPLAKAMLAWCDPALIDAVKAAERRFIPFHLNDFYQRTGGVLFRLLPDAEVRDPQTEGSWPSSPSYTWLTAAWEAVERDFRHRLTTEIYLMGVQIAPQPETESRPIPQAWASDASLDLARSALGFAGRRYVAVTASKEPPAETPSSASIIGVDQGSSRPITPDNVCDLSDDEIMLVLEELARRVVEEEDAPLLMPSRISFAPILRRRLHWEASQGSLRSTLGAQAKVLETWLREKVTSHQTPTAKSIENNIRDDYNAMKPRSNAMKP